MMRFAMYGKDVAEQKIPNTIHYLDMCSPPTYKYQDLPTRFMWAEHIQFASIPDPDFFQYMYNRIGKSWSWFYYSNLTLETIKQYLANKFVFYLYHHNQPVGFSILHKDTSSSANLAYFGLVPEACGLGLGYPFLQYSVLKLWELTDKRIWVYTTQYDSPAAIPIYQKAGFKLSHSALIEEYFPNSKVPANVR
jgi:GNAT superfamily N-acetyltransferase